MIEATTYSEYDCCDFAIIHINDEWIAKQNDKLDFIKKNPTGCISYHKFEDSAVNFYMDDSDRVADSLLLLDGNLYCFVELEPDEEELFSVPQEQLVSYTMSLTSDGYAYYYAVGIETGEDFWTKEFPLNQLIEQL